MFVFNALNLSVVVYCCLINCFPSTVLLTHRYIIRLLTAA